MKATALWKSRMPGIFSGSFLFAVGDRTVCFAGDRGLETLFAADGDGRLLWRYSFASGEHGLFFPFEDHVYLDGQRAVCIAVANGRVVAERQLDSELTQQRPSALGPLFLRGPLISATGLVGLAPITLETQWEWPDVNCIARGHWLGRAERGRPIAFTRIPDLLQVEVDPLQLPFASGLESMFVSERGTWCSFGPRERAAVQLPSGRIVWRAEEDEDGHHRILWSTDRFAYGGTAQLSAYRLEDGGVEWRQTSPGLLSMHAAATPNYGFVVVDKRQLHRVDLRSGQFEGKFQSPADIIGVAAVGDRRAVIGTSRDLIGVGFD